ncbi:Bcirc20 [Botrytis cinerea B05.10]|uniref:Bcirc20 n=1 Tax=Botryotinia fuckeliana (strain B05.10) TaxID=332648 RepID=A0A384JHB8_BOTFB|nr:Bcirc20 [Botrytis cinerea B05.10]ATZ49983.1 Bcirc20 [Botrytis cinerea B05.10]
MAPVKPEWEQDFAIIPEGSIFAPELEAQRTDNAKDNVPLEKAPSVFVADVTDALINYLTADQNASEEPLTKRQKLTTGSRLESSSGHVSQDYITVKQTALEVRCLRSKLPLDCTTLNRQKIHFTSHWGRQGGSTKPSNIILRDDNNNSLLTIPLSLEHASMSIQDSFDDVLICLMVDRDSKRRTQQLSKLWTEAGISVYKTDESDYIRIDFTIKWEITTNPTSIQPKKTDALLKVLNTYFPNPNITSLKPLSAQDFYQSAHSPDPDDEIAASIETPGLESTLYPFQKRAVQWMLRREGFEWSRATGCIERAQSKAIGRTPPSFFAVKDLQGRSCYVSHLFAIVTFDLAPFFWVDQEIKGGILAEEMGLGKTVEMIALMTLHTRHDQDPSIFDPFSGETLQTTHATLIISPPSISKQWIDEIKTHAPKLKVTYYEGIKSRKLQYETTMNDFVTSDIVITTYSILTSEIHFTSLNPERTTLRSKSKYQRLKSPLMKFSWWRVCLDEAQMVESGVGKAATVAKMIPRINAWAITGTPVRKNINDLLGLLIFLKYELLVSVWRSLVYSKQDFHKLFGAISLRHSKQKVRGELILPKQHRFVITLSFNPIEEQFYQEMFGKMCEESGLDTEGEPLMDGWDPKVYAEVMRRWLVRLRQATNALPPKRSTRRKRIGDEPMVQTASKALELMFSQTDVAIRANSRSLLLSQLKRGQLFEDSPRVQEALDIWKECVTVSSTFVDQARDELSTEILSEKARLAFHSESSSNSMIAETQGTIVPSKSQSIEGNGEKDLEAQDGSDPDSRVVMSRARLRASLELHHMGLFFLSNAYFQIKSNEEMTAVNSAEFENLDMLERQGYEEAKELRREILQDAFKRTDTMMSAIRRDTESSSAVQLPQFIPSTLKGGSESRRIMEEFEKLGINLDRQAHQINEWRNHLIQILLSPLVDNDDEDIAISGDEYENSIKVQEEVVVYVQALRTMIADRQSSLSGVQNYLIDEEAKTAFREAKHGKGPFPEKLIALFNIRALFLHKIISVRGTLSELRTLISKLKTNHSQNELSIVEAQLKLAHNYLTDQTKAATNLEKEIGLFTKCMNLRVEYYKQLQAISNQVAPYTGPNNDGVNQSFLRKEHALNQNIASLRAKRRYLVHLKEEVENPKDKRTCVVCREGFDLGVLTVCGHQYCSDCAKEWWKLSHRCPICKEMLIYEELHNISYKPHEPTLTTEAEGTREPLKERSLNSNSPQKSAIYSDVSKATLSAIKNIELQDNKSFGTKIDTLARHILYLRESDPGSKSIVFSQFTEFLPVLASAFDAFRIGHSSIDRPNGVEKFKNDPGIEVFLLHSRAHSAGLTLVNASNIFFCEPLLNTAIALQGESRVHRIGQKFETNIWVMVMGNTVDQSIYELSFKRRLDHLGHTTMSKKGKERAVSDEELVTQALEEADSLEMQQSVPRNLLLKGHDGEAVSENDLWTCLFGGRTKRTTVNLIDGGSSDFLVEIEKSSGASTINESIANDA